MARSPRSLSGLVTASVLLAAIGVAVAAPLTTSNAAAAAPLPEIYNPAPEKSVMEGASGHLTRVTLSFGRTGDLSTASSAKLTLVDDTATRGSDYTVATYTKILRWPAGTSFVRFYLNVRGDAVAEPDETFNWHLSDPTGATIRADSADGSVVILNDDSAALPTLSVEDASTYESNSIPTQATFIVRRSGSTAATALVKIVTVDGTARAPGDYAARSTTLYFRVGQTWAHLQVPIKEDMVPEPDETFSVQLSAPVRATIADGTAVASIRDDDSSEPPELVAQDSQVNEHGVGLNPGSVYVLHRHGDLRGTSTVTWTTSDGTAQAPGDYQAKSGKITFRSGDEYGSVTLSLTNDRVPEPREHFFITFSDPSAGTTISDPVAQIYLYDDD